MIGDCGKVLFLPDVCGQMRQITLFICAGVF